MHSHTLTIRSIEGNFGRKFIGIAGLIIKEKFEVEDLIRRIKSIANKHNVIIQAVDSRAIISLRQVFSAVFKALRAFHDGRNTCEKLEIEFLLYLSGKRQIRDAIEAIGIKGNMERIALIVIGESYDDVNSTIIDVLNNINGIIDSSFLEFNEDKLKFLRKVFEISDNEINAIKRSDLSLLEIIERLIIERGALIDVQK